MHSKVLRKTIGRLNRIAAGVDAISTDTDFRAGEMYTYIIKKNVVGIPIETLLCTLLMRSEGNRRLSDNKTPRFATELSSGTQKVLFIHVMASLFTFQASKRAPGSRIRHESTEYILPSSLATFTGNVGQRIGYAIQVVLKS